MKQSAGRIVGAKAVLRGVVNATDARLDDPVGQARMGELVA